MTDTEKLYEKIISMVQHANAITETGKDALKFADAVETCVLEGLTKEAIDLCLRMEKLRLAVKETIR